jgi:UDP-N-acetylmuramoylalanine--D-glutamate ligase
MIPLQSLPDRPFAVLGLGASGRAACRALLAAGKPVSAWDDDADVRRREAAAGLPIEDPQGRRDMAGFDSLVLSPGIPHTYPEAHPLVTAARRAGCPVIGDGELLARALPDARSVGITGTNGKSTTTALIGHILAVAGRPCAVGGNLGTPVLALTPPGRDGVFVLEMSSYQLELTPSLTFVVAVLLNVTPDHLSRHGGMDGYVAAKRMIFRGAGDDPTAIVGVDDPICAGIADELEAEGRWRVVRVSGRRAVPGGVYAEDGHLIDDTDAMAAKVIDLADAPALPGAHNAQNAAAAVAAVRALGIDRAVAARGLSSFPGLAHRQERLATLGGLTFVNDSKATNAEAAARALSCYENIYWIAGGQPKGDDLAVVEPYLSHVRHAFLIGEAEELFARRLGGRLAVTRAGTLARAVAAALRQAKTDGASDAVVLLSPACASFDQFRNFEARGDAFRRLVMDLTP